MSQDSGVGDEIWNEVVLPYFKALKKGNVNQVKQYLSENLYNQNRRLFVENSEYPDFLRSYYGDSKLSVIKTVETMGHVEFEVLVEFPDGSQSTSTLTVKKDGESNALTGKSRWQISRIH
jgi:hypothetical protein